MDRVLQVIGGLSRAGAETMLMNLYRGLDKDHVQFDFLIYKNEKQDYEDEIIAMGGRVIRISVHGITAPLQYIHKIRKVIDTYGPYKAIHIHTLHNGAFGLLAARPFHNMVKVMHSHNTKNDNKRFLASMYENMTLHIIRNDSDKCIACGVDAGRYLFGKRFDEEGMVLNNGIPIREYMREYSSEICQIKKEFGIEDGDMVIGCIGRLEDVKNHRFAIQIAHILHNNKTPFKLLIVGTGILKDSLQADIHAFGLQNHVILTGVRSDIPALLKTMDVFLMPSLFEGLPVTMVEAQAAGIPCLVSEAITKEADIGLQLVEYLSLRKPAEVWAQRIMDVRGKRLQNTGKIAQALEKNGFDSEKNVETLLRIYGMET